MSENNKPPIWFWIAAIVALIWNAMGVNAYLAQAYMSADTLAAMSELEQGMYADYPAWATAAFALAVWCGALGSILLLLRKGLAYLVLVLSLLGIIVQMIYNVFMSKALEAYGPGGLVMPIMVLIIGIALVWLAKIGKARGWLS